MNRRSVIERLRGARHRALRLTLAGLLPAAAFGLVACSREAPPPVPRQTPSPAPSTVPSSESPNGAAETSPAASPTAPPATPTPRVLSSTYPTPISWKRPGDYAREARFGEKKALFDALESALRGLEAQANASSEGDALEACEVQSWDYRRDSTASMKLGAEFRCRRREADTGWTRAFRAEALLDLDTTTGAWSARP